ncbi:DoxX family protein [Streptomyces lavenduligriseus]|nr:DoxX family protein [Streptomyces lavenduligriseus]
MPAPTVTARAVTVGESAGGVFLVLGLLSRLTALSLTVHMCLAMVLVNAGTGFTTPRQGVASGAGTELPPMKVAALLVVLPAGPGPLALDRVLGVEAVAPGRHRPACGRPSAVRASVVSGAIGGVIGAVMSALVSYSAVGVPSSAGANAADHAVSGLVSGFLTGFLGLLAHQRRHGPWGTARDRRHPARTRARLTAVTRPVCSARPWPEGGPGVRGRPGRRGRRTSGWGAGGGRRDDVVAGDPHPRVFQTRL